MTAIIYPGMLFKALKLEPRGSTIISGRAQHQSLYNRDNEKPPSKPRLYLQLCIFQFLQTGFQIWSNLGISLDILFNSTESIKLQENIILCQPFNKNCIYLAHYFFLICVI